MGFFASAAELGGSFIRNAVASGTRVLSEAADKVSVAEHAVETKAGESNHAGVAATHDTEARAAKAGREFADAARRTLSAAASKTMARAKVAADKVKKAARLLKKGMNQFGNEAVNTAVATCHTAKKTAGAAINAGVDKSLNVSNTTVNKVGGAAASALTASRYVESSVVNLLVTKAIKEMDGCFLDENCTPSKSLPKRGKRPSCGGYDGIPKVMYTNGINTEAETCCETMTKLATSRCVEVVGVYNATSGLLSDVAECVQNINRAGNTPAVTTQVTFLKEQLSDSSQTQVTLFAHSQGGLITQESLVKLRNDLTAQYILGPPPESGESAAAHAEKDLGRITVNSFGTAEEGWPNGPVYNRFTNTKDPVPIVIKSVQGNHPDLYPQKPVEGEVHRFSKAHLNPIGSHSMDGVYLDHFNKTVPYDQSVCKCGK
jgi:hypothetical protein